MDINSLYFRHQLLMMRARAVADGAVRLRHLSHASAIARRISRFQETLGANAADAWLRESAR